MIKLVRKGNELRQYDRREFVISSEGDVANLPKVGGNVSGEVTGHGSVAYTQDLQHIYLLGPDDVWREV